MTIARRFLAAFCVLVLAALVMVPFIQVMMRDVAGAAIIGAEEFTRFLLIVLVFAAYPLVVAERENIVMSEFHEAMPPALRRAVAFLITATTAAAAAFIAYVAWITIFKNLNNATPTLKIPFWIFLGSTFFGFAAAALLHLIDLRHPPQQQTKVY